MASTYRKQQWLIYDLIDRFKILSEFTRFTVVRMTDYNGSIDPQWQSYISQGYVCIKMVSTRDLEKYAIMIKPEE